MSGWGLIRRAEDEDIERLETSARRFIARHGLPAWTLGHNVAADLEMVLERDAKGGRRYEDGLTRLWRRCVRRALREPSADGIAYEYIGYYAE